MTNDTWTFNPADLNDGDNVVTVVVDPTGLEEDYDGDDTFKVGAIWRFDVLLLFLIASTLEQTPRGIRGYRLLGGGDFDAWKIQGNLGGEDYPDKVRGPLNEGGLFVERAGLFLPFLNVSPLSRIFDRCPPS